MHRVLINIDVPDVVAGVGFYTAGLGFELQRTLFDGTVAELILGETVIYLLQAKQGSTPYAGATQTRTFQRHWTPVHLDIVVDDLDAAVTRALAAGAVSAGAPSVNDWGCLAPLADPFGHGVCLLQFIGRGYAEVADPV